jgi:hypothetical protein
MKGRPAALTHRRRDLGGPPFPGERPRHWPVATFLSTVKPGGPGRTSAAATFLRCRRSSREVPPGAVSSGQLRSVGEANGDTGCRRSGSRQKSRHAAEIGQPGEFNRPSSWFTGRPIGTERIGSEREVWIPTGRARATKRNGHGLAPLDELHERHNTRNGPSSLPPAAYGTT